MTLRLAPQNDNGNKRNNGKRSTGKSFEAFEAKADEEDEAHAATATNSATASAAATATTTRALWLRRHKHWLKAVCFYTKN